MSYVNNITPVGASSAILIETSPTPVLSKCIPGFLWERAKPLTTYTHVEITLAM